MMLDLDPDAEENQGKVRIAWPTSGVLQDGVLMKIYFFYELLL
jgi:hypothetical protein